MKLDILGILSRYYLNLCGDSLINIRYNTGTDTQNKRGTENTPVFTQEDKLAINGRLIKQ